MPQMQKGHSHFTKQAGFSNTVPKYHNQFPGFDFLWSLVEKNKECGNISDAILDTFDARKANSETFDQLKQLSEQSWSDYFAIDVGD